MRREGTPARTQAVEPCQERRPRMPVAAQTRLYHLGGLFPTPLYHLGGLFPTPLYHLGGCSRRRSTTYIPVGVHPCRRTSL